MGTAGKKTHNQLAEQYVGVEVKDVCYGGRKRWDALGLWLVEFDKELAWYTGIEYTGHTLRQVEDGWQMIVRGRRRNEHLVAFVGGSDVLEVYRNLWSAVTKDFLRFKPDKFKVQV
mgnify:CR=1 FL=1|jgi:hypothetical protein